MSALSTTRAVILAGGKGTRLAPYTSILPKPLMPIGDRAILQIVIEQLQAAGLADITLCVGHLSHLIRAVCGTGPGGDARISYVQEDEALGTAGPLKLLEGLDRRFLVMNGDILTTLAYGDLVAYHEKSENILTIATHKRKIKINYGVLHLDPQQPEDQRIMAFEEKPELASTVSMGVYLLEPRALEYIPEGEYFDLPDLVAALLDHDERVGAYTYDGLWFDIGSHDDYQRAVVAWEEHHANGHNGHKNGAQTVSLRDFELRLASAPEAVAHG